jgi:hypothetical protein
MWYPHQVAEKIPRGEIVKVEFTTWPLGMVFDEGEEMRVRISGRDMCLIEADVCESLLLVLILGYSKWLIGRQSDAECWNAHWRQQYRITFYQCLAQYRICNMSFTFQYDSVIRGSDIYPNDGKTPPTSHKFRLEEEMLAPMLLVFCFLYAELDQEVER